MVKLEERVVTVIYYMDGSLELMHESAVFEQNPNGRVIIPPEFKKNKSIVAVCSGEVEILNKVGERVIGVDYIE